VPGGRTHFPGDTAHVFIITDDTCSRDPTVPNCGAEGNMNAAPVANPNVTTSYNDQFSIGESDVGPQLELQTRVGTGIIPDRDTIELTLQGMTLENRILSNLDIQTVGHAELSLQLVSRAIDEVIDARGATGAQVNRLESAARNLEIATENTDAARSALLDLDVAKQINQSVNESLLVQSGVSVTAQANQLPQLLLTLLT